MCISSWELLQDTSELRLKRWERELAGSAGRAGAHSRHCMSLQLPARLMHEERRDHMLELFPGNCWKEGGNGLAPTNHLSLEGPLSADTRHCPHTLGTSLRAALAPMVILVLLSHPKPQQSSHCPLQSLLESPNQGRTSGGLTRH